LGDFGVSVSPNTVGRLLHQMGYSLRPNHKKLSTDHSPDRNHQFLYLSDLRERFQRRGHPITTLGSTFQSACAESEDRPSRGRALRSSFREPHPVIVAEEQRSFRHNLPPATASVLYPAQARLSSNRGKANLCQKENWLRKEESQQPSSSSLLCKLTSPLVERMIAHGFPTRLE